MRLGRSTWNLAYKLSENFRREVGPVADGNHVVKLFELSLDLLQFWFIGHVEEDSARLAARQRHDNDGIEIEGAAGKQSGDVRHRAGMVAHHEFEDGGCARRFVI